MKKVIAVIGATGAQGGGLAKAILDDANGEFGLRAITRNPAAEKGAALAARGAEVVAADLDDVESLTKAFEGAYGAFLVTNFWEHFSPEKEKEQARNMAEAASRAGVQHVIWSTLEDTRELVPLDDPRMPTLMGQYKVPHFDAKGEADAYFRERNVPVTFLRASYYWDNMIHFGMHPRRGADGVLELALPMGDRQLGGVAAADIGPIAYGIFKRGPELVGQVVGAAGDHRTGDEMAAELGRALGEPVRYVDVPVETYRSLGFPGAEDLGNMFQVYQEFETELNEVRSIERSRQLHPGLQDFSAWAQANASRLPVEPLQA